MSEPTMSKYAAKKKAQAEAGYAYPAPPPEPPAKAPKTPPDGDEYADLGPLPALCYTAILEAIGAMEKARNVAAEMERRSACGLQRQEPMAIRLTLNTKLRWLRGLAKRAERIR